MKANKTENRFAKETGINFDYNDTLALHSGQCHQYGRKARVAHLSYIHLELV